MTNEDVLRAVYEVKQEQYFNKKIDKLSNEKLTFETILDFYKSVLRDALKAEKYRELLLRQNMDKQNCFSWGVASGNAQLSKYFYSLLKCIDTKKELV